MAVTMSPLGTHSHQISTISGGRARQEGCKCGVLQLPSLRRRDIRDGAWRWELHHTENLRSGGFPVCTYCAGCHIGGDCGDEDTPNSNPFWRRCPWKKLEKLFSAGEVVAAMTSALVPMQTLMLLAYRVGMNYHTSDGVYL